MSSISSRYKLLAHCMAMPCRANHYNCDCNCNVLDLSRLPEDVAFEPHACEPLRVAAQNDVCTTPCHVGGNGHRGGQASLGYNLQPTG